ncbi:condensation domain-containing protein [Williamsia sp.]|uniref:condensation domain-containing protein n=1 Tax=Williamsia sp. TaxID=1872085 RepID=UPI001A2BF6E5|nr:condensation domain-containing protein [Williamsia sp.]MBJ7288195.1 peptide synthase [Williamsia sp.]
MRVTTIDRYTPVGGTLHTWSVNSSDSRPIVSKVPPSFNQSFHLAAVGESTDAPSTWLAASFDVEGSIDLKAMEQAYTMLIARHGTLHSGFVRENGAVVRRLHDPATLRLDAAAPVVGLDSDGLRTHLWDALNASCPVFGPPSYLLGAVDRTDRSTIICGFDHAHVDAYSMAIVIDDLHQLYEGCLAEPGGFCPRRLPQAGSFVDYCATEADDDRDYRTHPAMSRWLEFFERHRNTPPSFPLDLGLAPGEQAPQAVDLRQVLDRAGLESFERVCRDHGASVFAGVLAAMAQAAHNLGAGREMSVLFPMHTRRSRLWQNAVGWFTTNAPLTVRCADDVLDTLAATGPALRAAVALGEIPVPHVLEAIGGLNRLRDDIFMVSYIDYRRLPGAAAHATIDAHHISNVTTADDAQFWISRTDDGVALRSRYPDTPTAHTQLDAFFTELEFVVRSII